MLNLPCEYTAIYTLKEIVVTYKEPGGLIWKIIPDEKGAYLAIELRHAEHRKTALSVLSLSDNTLLYTIEQLPKPWWLGLVAIENNTIILQGYKESASPEPKGYYIFDLLTGILLDQKEEDVYHAVSDIKSGAVSFFPLLYNEDNAHYKTIVDFLKQHHGYNVCGPLEYLEYEKVVLISFYIQEDKKMTNILVVLDEEGTIVLKDTLIEGASGVGMATFFICNTKLIYIKNKTSIALAEMI